MILRRVLLAGLLAISLAACDPDDNGSGGTSGQGGMSRGIAAAPPAPMMSKIAAPAGNGMQAPEAPASGEAATAGLEEREPEERLAYTHDRRLTVTDPGRHIERLRQICRDMSGCTMLSVRIDGPEIGGAFEARLPKPGVEVMDGYLAGIAEGEALERQTAAEDLSDQVVDVSRRLALLRQHRDRLQGLYERPDATLEDLITLSREIADTQTRLELATGDYGRIENRISRDLYRVQVMAPATGPGLLDPFKGLGRDLIAGLIDAFRDGLSLLVWLIGMLPALLPVALVLTFLVRFIRRRRR